MNALETIKDCKKAIAFADKNGSYTTNLIADYYFLLKAFKVMREIAIERGEHDQSYKEDEIVDDEFEKRMKE